MKKEADEGVDEEGEEFVAEEMRPSLATRRSTCESIKDLEVVLPSVTDWFSEDVICRVASTVLSSCEPVLGLIMPNWSILPRRHCNKKVCNEKARDEIVTMKVPPTFEQHFRVEMSTGQSFLLRHFSFCVLKKKFCQDTL